jgi:tetratricopeptide (TPR) repeat protein
MFIYIHKLHKRQQESQEAAKVHKPGFCCLQIDSYGTVCRFDKNSRKCREITPVKGIITIIFSVERMEDCMYRFATVLLIFIMLLVARPFMVFAETPTITATGEYTMGEGETMPVAKERALAEAVKAAAEQAGVYIESYSKVSNLILTKDEVNVLARGVVEVLDKQYDEPKYIGSDCYLRVTITARVDTSNIEELRSTLQNKSLAADLKRLQAAYEDCQQDIKRLKVQLGQASGNEKKNIVQRIAENERRFRVARLIEQGYNSAEKKSFEASLQAFSQAIDVDQRYAFAYLSRGKAYYELKQLDLALADYNKAIALDSTDDSAYYCRGVLYGSLKRYDLAIADYEKAIAINPNNAYALNNRGIVYASAKQYDLAMADYNKSIAIDPNNANAYDNRGNAYFELRQYQQALTDYDKSIALDPNNQKAYNNRGQVKNALGQYELAIADFDKAILLGLNNTYVYNSRGMAYNQLRKYQEAITNYNKAIELGPDNVVAYYYRGVANYNLRNFESAIADYDKVLALDPGRLKGAYFYKGLALAYLQRRQEAIDVLRLYIRNGDDANRIETAKNVIRQLGGMP